MREVTQMHSIWLHYNIVILYWNYIRKVKYHSQVEVSWGLIDLQLSQLDINELLLRQKKIGFLYWKKKTIITVMTIEMQMKIV